jgi:hypothetical protein
VVTSHTASSTEQREVGTQSHTGRARDVKCAIERERPSEEAGMLEAFTLEPWLCDDQSRIVLASVFYHSYQ